MKMAKERILYLYKILYEQTDEDHPLSIREMIEILKSKYGIEAHRTTIPKDIDVLREFDIDIIDQGDWQKKYFIGSRKFEFPELKILSDAVESSKLITEEQTKKMIEKLNTLCSVGEQAKLKSHNFVPRRIKPNNSKIMYIIDLINQAINSKKKISFCYYDYTGNKEKVMRNGGEVYVLSPYCFIWNDDYYYVIGYSDKREKVINFRVDRIVWRPEILDEKAVDPPADFDPNDFVNKAFYMFSGDQAEVELRCKSDVMKSMIDRFGEEVDTFDYNPEEDTFHLRTQVEVSPTFFGWVFEFGGKVKIIGPESVKEKYRQMLADALAEIN